MIVCCTFPYLLPVGDGFFVHVCGCVLLYLLYTEVQNLHPTLKVKTFLGMRILAGPHNFKGVKRTPRLPVCTSILYCNI